MIRALRFIAVCTVAGFVGLHVGVKVWWAYRVAKFIRDVERDRRAT